MKKKKHCRCLGCGFIRYSKTKMDSCPQCGLFVNSYKPKKEALSLLCEAFNVSRISLVEDKIKQAFDVIIREF